MGCYRETTMFNYLDDAYYASTNEYTVSPYYTVKLDNDLDLSQIDKTRLPLLVHAKNGVFLVGIPSGLSYTSANIKAISVINSEIAEFISKKIARWNEEASRTVNEIGGMRISGFQQENPIYCVLNASGLTIPIQRINEPNLHCEIANEQHNSVVAKLIYLLGKVPHLVDMSLRGYEEKTPLIVAAKVAGACDIVINYLLNTMLETNPEKLEQMNLNAQDDLGRTALHYLCAYGLKMHVDRLVELGADINIPDNRGMTPLDFSCADCRQIDFLMASIEIPGSRPANYYTELGGHRFDYPDFVVPETNKRPSKLSIADVCFGTKLRDSFSEHLISLGAYAGTGRSHLRGTNYSYRQDLLFLDRTAFKLKNCYRDVCEERSAKLIQRTYRRHQEHKISKNKPM